MPRSIPTILALALALPVMAWGEPVDIVKFRFRGEGVSFEVATPPDPCIKIVDRGEFTASVERVNKTPDAIAASFFIAVDNICSNDRLVSYGQMTAPALAMSVVGSGKTIALRGTLPITTDSLTTGTKTTEQLIFDLVLTAGSNSLRRLHGVEHVVLQDRGIRSTSTFDRREYANVTASGSISGVLAGLQIGLANIGNFAIQTQQDRSMQIQKF